MRRSSESNPGAATPCSLHNMYSKQAAAHANPYTLRSQSFSIGGLTENMVRCNSVPTHSYTPLRIAQTSNFNASAAANVLQRTTPFSAPKANTLVHTSIHTAAKAPFLRTSTTNRAISPPRTLFKVLNSRGSLHPHGGSDHPLSISLSGFNTISR